jgi:hypothetical protein
MEKVNELDGLRGLTFLIIVISHLNVLSKFLTTKLINRDHPVTIITPPGCPYNLGFYHFTRSNCNVEFSYHIQNYLEITKKPTIVIYFIRYAYYLEGRSKIDSGFAKSLPIMISKSDKDFSIGLKEALNNILEQGHKLVLIYPVPEISKDVPKEYRKKIYNKDFNLMEPYKKYLYRNKFTFKILDEIKNKNIFRFFPDRYLCEDKKNCIIKINNKILYTDADHLSDNGSEFLSPLILKLPVFKIN